MFLLSCLAVLFILDAVTSDAGCTKTCTPPLYLYETTCVCLQKYEKASCERGDDDATACQRIIDAGLCNTVSYRATCATGCGICTKDHVPVTSPQVILHLPKNSVETLYAIDCGQPTAMTNGGVSSSSTLFTSIARHTCDPGFNLIGHGLSKCMRGGWSSHGSRCDPDACSSTPCQNDGTCTSPSIGNFQCACPDGYGGNQCEEDPCHSIPCQNDGTCIVSGATYQCTCPEGYSGNECEQDPCHSIPCQNDGTCIVSGATYQCTCPEGYSGNECEQDPCHSIPCQNDGTCIVSGATYQCTCPEGYSGNECEQAELLGGNCVEDSNCEVLDSECFDGICKCTPGKRASANTCVTKCDAYGQSMTFYDDGLGISGYNEAELEDVTTVEDCAEACVAATEFICLSFDYEESSQECNLQDAGYLDVDEGDRRTSSSYIHGTRDCSAHGGSCSSDDECDAENSECFNNVCKCTPGYRFKGNLNKCVLECEHYGQTMTFYDDGLGISGYNKVELEDVATVEDCAEACVTETSFICLSFDYRESEDRCNLQDAGYLDVDEEDRKTSSSYIHGTRDCSAQGGVCNTDEDCDTVNSECFKHVCKCTLGYRFKPNINKCVRECDSYGQTMTFYEGRRISGYNEAVLEDVPTEEDCAEACVQETGFICLSFDYRTTTKKCNLQDVGYLDVDEDVRRTSTTRNHGTRDCSTHRDACSNDEQCDASLSECFDNICKCKPGLRFEENSNSCTAGCTLGQSMTLYEGLGIAGYKGAVLSNVPSVEDCINACLSENSFKCLSFDYEESSQECNLLTTGFFFLSDEQKYTGTPYIHGERDCSDHNRPCSQDRDCDVSNSACINNKCTCTPGYRFFEERKTCILTCTSYGTSLNYEYYYGIGIAEHNIRTIPNVPSYSQCAYKCDIETVVTCHSFDYDTSTQICFLKEVGYRDVPVEERLTDEANLVHGTRNCASYTSL